MGRARRYGGNGERYRASSLPLAPSSLSCFLSATEEEEKEEEIPRGRSMRLVRRLAKNGTLAGGRGRGRGRGRRRREEQQETRARR